MFKDEALPSSWPQYGNIEFRNVSLKYPAQNENLIADFNLMIPTGQRVSTTLHFFVSFRVDELLFAWSLLSSFGMAQFQVVCMTQESRICFWTSWHAYPRTNSIVKNTKETSKLEADLLAELKLRQGLGELWTFAFFLVMLFWIRLVVQVRGQFKSDANASLSTAWDWKFKNRSENPEIFYGQRLTNFSKTFQSIFSRISSIVPSKAVKALKWAFYCTCHQQFINPTKTL